MRCGGAREKVAVAVIMIHIHLSSHSRIRFRRSHQFSARACIKPPPPPILSKHNNCAHVVKEKEKLQRTESIFLFIFPPQVPPPVVRKKVPEPEEDRSSPVLQPDQSMDGVTKLTSQHAVVIFSKSSCGAMRDTMATLFRDLGVSSLAVVELDEDPKGKEMEEALARMMPSRPAVFVAGRPVGSTEEVMSLHLGGKLVPLLRDARAILPC